MLEQQGLSNVEICFLRPSDFSKAARLEKRVVIEMGGDGGEAVN